MNIKKQNGITLTILVITIVVMLILVGGTVGMIFDGKGLLRKSIESKKIQEEYANREEGKTNELINDVTDIMNTPKQKEYTFDYTGAVQEWKVPASGVWKLEVWGAQGGEGSTNGTLADLTTIGGKGGYSYGTVQLSANTKIYIYVGGEGKTSSETKLIEGGFNGGGDIVADTAQKNKRGSGGGATDIRIEEDSLYYRVIVAGAGGGTGGISGSGNDGEGTAGGYGGGITGHRGLNAYNNRTGGLPGTQVLGGTGGTYETNTSAESGSFGIGGNTIVYTSNTWSSASGGGGWYGGGAGGPGGNGGGGGSGWVYTEEAYTNWAANSVEGQSGQWKLDEKYYLTDAQTIAGSETFRSPSGEDETGHSGNGYARITWVGK